MRFLHRPRRRSGIQLYNVLPIRVPTGQPGLRQGCGHLWHSSDPSWHATEALDDTPSTCLLGQSGPPLWGAFHYYTGMLGVLIPQRKLKSSMASAKFSVVCGLPSRLELRQTLYHQSQDVQQFDFDRSGPIGFFLPLSSSDVPKIGWLSNLRMHSAARPVGTSASDQCEFAPTNLVRVDFLPGQFFDIRLEVHAPVNGSQATGNSVPDSSFKFSIAKAGAQAQSAASYFGISEPSVEHWNFTWFEGNNHLSQVYPAQHLLSNV